MGGRSVRVLGELDVDGADVRVELDRKSRLMLRLLAMARGRAVPTDALVDALWSGAVPPARPADQVAVLASRVRRVLGRGSVVHGDHGYRLAGVSLDLDELEAVVGETELRGATGETTRAVAAARVVLSLLRGSTVPDPTTDTDWVLADHAEALRLVARARHAAAAALLEVGAWAEALDLAAADARADLYDEVAVRLLMRAQVAAGRPALALSAYGDLRARLLEELGADPAPETEALHTAVLRGEVSSTPRVQERPGLVGRTSQLAHLDALVARVRQGGTRIAVVTGQAGMGKSTLLRTWVRGRRELGDTVLAGTCGPLDSSAPLDVVLAALGEHLRSTSDPGVLLGEDAGVLVPLIDPTGRPGGTPRPTDPVLGPETLYAALTAVLTRIAADRCAVLVVDDAHLAGPALGDWLRFVVRRPVPLLVVASVRPAEGAPLPATDEVGLGPLDLEETAELVGVDRAVELHARSAGHPLFLAELAGAPPGELPRSLVDAVVRRCDELGEASDLVRTAAVLGTDLDIELLASVLSRPALEILRGIEVAEQRGLLVEEAGRYTFRHELVREAIATGTGQRRTTLLHHEAASVLSRRPDADPGVVAEHARLGDDPALAARALRGAADVASSRFDHHTAEELLDRSLDLRRDDEALLARARVRIRLGRYRDAEADVRSAEEPGASGAEIAAWAAYFDRRFDDAADHASHGEVGARDDQSSARCLTASGRIRHARGDLAVAEEKLTAALALGTGPDRITAGAWLGVLMAHRSRLSEARELLRPATHPTLGVDSTSPTLHALLFTGHVHALAGRPADALATFERYTSEVERRQVPRFRGRGTNFGGWVLRSLAARGEAVEAHQEALAVADTDGIPEMRVAALEDLAEAGLEAGEPDRAGVLLAQAEAALRGDLVFGWRLAMKLQLLKARWALATGDAEDALQRSGALRAEATEAGVPRYASVASLLVHRARADLGEPVDLDRAWADLAEVERSVRLEAWWWAGETGAALGQDRWLERAADLARALARESGERAATLLTEADRRLTGWATSGR